MSTRATSVVVAVALLLGLGWVWARHVQAQHRVERERLGERLYEQGLGVNGAPVKGLVRTDVEVDGTITTCASCHLRAGHGSIEGTLRVPPIVGDVLFAPLPQTYKGVLVQGAPAVRPAYTRETFARAVREGLDANGHPLRDAMPRFALSDDDVDAVMAWLEVLGKLPARGVEPGLLHLATVFSDDVPAEQLETVRFAQAKYVGSRNALVRGMATQGLDNRSGRMAVSMTHGAANDVSGRQFMLHEWVLHGPRSTWGAQLTKYAAEQPVFALVGGVVTGSFAEVAAFADAQHVPVLFPSTRQPVETRWAVYLQGGVTHEATVLAHALEGTQRVGVAASPSSDDQAGAAAFVAARKTLSTVRASLPGDAQVDAWVVFGDAALVTQFARTGTPTWAVGARPDEVPAGVRCSWPWREPEADVPYRLALHEWVKDEAMAMGPPTPTLVATAANVAALQVLSSALMDLNTHYSGEALLDAVAMLKDDRLPLFDRLGFAPGQSVASRGVWVMEAAADGGVKPVGPQLTW